MYLDEFKQYLENYGRSYERFMQKAIDYQNTKNARRTPASKRWSDEKIEREAEKMWTGIIKNIYEKIKANGKFKKRFVHQEEIDDWIQFMNEHEILDSFSESVDELEFE
ncbi:hypothetical protein BN1356_00964 [Streptococcus varani]|uniref:Uncharacterized protein n=1 Tax=Streptococcus varani TaxID=1608583 RepID=A0A0E4CSJ6_9STRE|nr:hypothetical protein [Streptococcus varani]CQR24620.1 hypothetical protein BN1356_00964 [Streptococcus varani]